MRENKSNSRGGNTGEVSIKETTIVEERSPSNVFNNNYELNSLGPPLAELQKNNQGSRGPSHYEVATS